MVAWHLPESTSVGGDETTPAEHPATTEKAIDDNASVCADTRDIAAGIWGLRDAFLAELTCDGMAQLRVTSALNHRGQRERMKFVPNLLNVWLIILWFQLCVTQW